MEANKNNLLDNYMKVLLTKDHTNELKISIDNDTENVKEVLRDIESIQNPLYLNPFYQYSPKYQSLKKDEYTSGKAGIGPFALNNAHHVLTQLVDMKMAENAFTKRLGLVDLGKVYDDEGVNRSGNRTRVLSWLSALINAFVDIAKDPYIVRLNVNAYTYNIAAYLTRMGKGEATYYFLNQPIMKDIAQAVLKTRGKYGIDQHVSQSQREKAVIRGVLNKYDYETHSAGFKTLITDEQKANMFSELLNPIQLRKLMMLDKNDENFNYSQIYIYYGFLELNKYAEAMSDLVKYSKIDTKKMGKTFAEQHIYDNGIDELMLDSRFQAGEVRRFFNETFLQVKRENSISFGAQMFKGQLIRNTPTFVEIQDMILNKINRKTSANEKILKPIIRGMEAAVKSQFFNELIIREGINVKDMFYGNNSMASRLLDLKQRILSGQLNGYLNPDGSFSNYLLEYLMSNIGKTETLYQKPDFINTFSMFDTDIVGQNSLIDSWQELYDDEKTHYFARDLAIYAFITTGDNPSMNNFFKYLSNTIRKEFGYDEYIRRTLNQFNEGSSVNINWKDVFLNNWQNNDLVKPLEYEKTYLEQGKDPVTGEDDFVINTYRFINIPSNFSAVNSKYPVMDAFAGVRNKNRDNIKPIGYFRYLISDGVKIKEVSAPKYPPFVKIKYSNDNAPHNTLVYELVGVLVKANEIKNDFIPVYKLTNKKGYKMHGNVITEYGRTDGYSFNNFPSTVDAETAIQELSLKIKNVTGTYTIEEYDRLENSTYSDFYGQEEPFIPESTYTPQTIQQDSMSALIYDSPTEFALHSGGAVGADTVWGEIAEEYGIEVNHYRPEHLTEELKAEAMLQVTKANNDWLHRRFPVQPNKNRTQRSADYINGLIMRDWLQVKYSDAVFAVATLSNTTENEASDAVENATVNGGTGYAVQMALQNGKPVHVFDLNTRKWYYGVQTSPGMQSFTPIETPILTQNFAGIGTREITDAGKQAIRDVFEKTFGSKQMTNKQKEQEGKNIKDQCKGE